MGEAASRNKAVGVIQKTENLYAIRYGARSLGLTIVSVWLTITTNKVVNSKNEVDKIMSVSCI